MTTKKYSHISTRLQALADEAEADIQAVTNKTMTRKEAQGRAESRRIDWANIAFLISWERRKL